MTERPLTGWHVFLIFFMLFTAIISANALLAFHAVRSFPGLEVQNSYIASQTFEEKRFAQINLDWTVKLTTTNNQLDVAFSKGRLPITPLIEHAQLSRPAGMHDDQALDFVYDGRHFTTLVDLRAGRWVLRLKARSEDGTLFQKRFVFEVPK